jgi:hypothetical protein
VVSKTIGKKGAFLKIVRRATTNRPPHSSNDWRLHSTSQK